MPADAADLGRESVTTDSPSEAGDSLEREATLAGRAMLRVLGDLKRTLAGALSPPGDVDAPAGAKGLAASHPYYTLAGAAAAGFLAASVFVPSKESQVLRKLAALERAAAHGRGAVRDKPGKGVMGVMVGALAAAVRPAVLHAITVSLAAKTAAATNGTPHEGDPGADGHERHPTPRS